MRWIALTACVVTTLGFAACSGSDPSPTASTTEALSDALFAGGKPIKVPQSANPYTLFETLQVRPLAVSLDGHLLFAANTPDNRLEIFRVDGERLWPVGSVEVGLEPVAVAVREPGEVWVVNHLSDSVSIVDVSDADAPARRQHAAGRRRAARHRLRRPAPRSRVHHDRPSRPELAGRSRAVHARRRTRRRLGVRREQPRRGPRAASA